MPIHEQTLNEKITEILRSMRRGWRISAEETGVFRGKAGRPDIIVRQENRPAVLIENEYLPARGVEAEAAGRLGLEMKSGGDIVKTVIALRSPAALKKTDSRQLKEAAAAAEFDYALLTPGKKGEKPARFPEQGWLTGNLGDLADFIYRASVPAELLGKLVISMEYGVDDAAKIARNLPEKIGKEMEKILQQQAGEQTRRMAMVILLNALIFQEVFAGNSGAGSNRILSISETLRDGVRKQKILDEWTKILKINYWPIFGVAKALLIIIPEKESQLILGRLIKTAADMAVSAFSSPDIFGVVFQRLIADRKFLATFYTRPESAALLANLAIPQKTPFADGSWEKNAGDYIVADFACGTGALLASVYKRVAELHEKHGGDMEETHVHMMEKSFIGCDVMPAAVHLTSSILSGMSHKKPFKETKLYIMPYGESEPGEIRIGSLDLLESRGFLPVLSTSAEKAGGQGKIKAEREEVLWEEPHLVIMNPPFTRPTNHEGAHKDIPNPAFAAFGADTELQKKLGDRNKRLREGTCGSGNAGLASDFVALADKMVCQDGIVAFVLPLTAMAGESWKKVRAMWAKHYRDIRVVSLAAMRADECSWSADTSMAEILFIGKKINGRKGTTPDKKGRRGIFIAVNKRPENEIKAGEYARIINRALAGKIRKLEDGPVGGTPIIAGGSQIGQMLDAPLPQTPEEPWEISRIRDMALAQTAHELVHGRLWLPRWARMDAVNLPICKLGALADRGYISRDINGIDGKKIRGAFDILPLSESEPEPTYPCLWAADSEKETRLIVAPDRRGAVRKGRESRAREIWQTASRAHHNVDCGFGSRSLTVAMTEKPTIGGRAWVNVLGFKNQMQEDAYALWGNSTLGFLLYWWYSNKPQGSRGTISPVRLPTMPVLDLTKLSAKQLAAARKGFNVIKNKKLLPFYRIDEDATRAELDEIILINVLGLPKKVLDGVALLREKLSREPSIRGGKESEEEKKTKKKTPARKKTAG